MKTIIQFAVLAAVFALAVASSAAENFRALVFSKTIGYRHASITNGWKMLRQLGAENQFAVDVSEDAAVFTAENLARYRVVVFLSTIGDVFNDPQQEAFKGFVEGGGGFVAIHAAIPGKVATEGDWPWYVQTLCTEFANHKKIEQATVRVEDPTNPSTAHLPASWVRTDEWYNFTSSPRGKVHVLANLDEKSFHGGTMGEDHPVAWCRLVGAGRVWYTALGHTEASYTEPEFVKHVMGGIQTAAGLKPSKFKP